MQRRAAGNRVMAKAKSAVKHRVTQVRSAHHRSKQHRACIAGLGLRHIGHTVEVQDSLAVRGMLSKVGYLLRVEESDD